MSSIAELLKAHKELQSFMTGKMAHFEAQYVDNINRATPEATINMPPMPPDYCEFKIFAVQMFNLFAQQIEQLQSSVDTLETRQRSNILLLKGLPEEAGEDVFERTVTVLRDKCFKDFGSSSLQRCHRLGSRAEGVTRSVLMCFSDQKTRQDLWKLKSKLKGSPFSINEFLTKSRQSVYQEARKHFGIGNCWTQDAVIHVKVPDGSRKKVILRRDLQALIKAFPPGTNKEVETSAKKSSRNHPRRGANRK